MRRQFNLKFKKNAVKAYLNRKASGVQVKHLCQVLSIGTSQLYYWVDQDNKGLLRKGNAIAFSRNPSAMVRG
jgi:transposase-like protein